MKIQLNFVAQLHFKNVYFSHESLILRQFHNVFLKNLLNHLEFRNFQEVVWRKGSGWFEFLLCFFFQSKFVKFTGSCSVYVVTCILTTGFERVELAYREIYHWNLSNRSIYWRNKSNLTFSIAFCEGMSYVNAIIRNLVGYLNDFFYTAYLIFQYRRVNLFAFIKSIILI